MKVFASFFLVHFPSTSLISHSKVSWDFQVAEARNRKECEEMTHCVAPDLSGSLSPTSRTDVAPIPFARKHAEDSKFE